MADLREAYLFGADLRGADLRWVSDLTLTQDQLHSARGDATTQLPERLKSAHSHWAALWDTTTRAVTTWVR
jgi:hypothetical protein